MRYLGGKKNLAKQIGAVIRNTADRLAKRTYLEPFVGGGSVLADVCQSFDVCLAGDTSVDLILLWQALLQGWQPPSSMSEVEYQELRKTEPSAMRGFAGFPCSFGGKWFGGLARGGGRNHVDEGRRGCLRKAESLAGRQITFECRSYDEWSIDEDTIVYCDIPYVGTEMYQSEFDAPAFWQWATKMSNVGIPTLVSELSAPPDWSSLWHKERKVGSTVAKSGSGNAGRLQCDHVFIHESFIDRLKT